MPDRDIIPPATGPYPEDSLEAFAYEHGDMHMVGEDAVPRTAYLRARQFYNERNLPQPYYDLLDAAVAEAAQGAAAPPDEGVEAARSAGWIFGMSAWAAAQEPQPDPDVKRLAEWFHNKWEGQGIACYHRNQHLRSWDCGTDAIEAAEYARLSGASQDTETASEDVS